MDYDTKQQPKNKRTRSKKKELFMDESIYLNFHGRNYSNCLDYVKDYAESKKLVITFVEVKNEHMPSPLYEAKGLEWQIWRKNYGEIVKHYWTNNLLDKKVMVLDNTASPAKEGFTRLYRAIPAQDLAQPSQPKKVKSFVKKAPRQEKILVQNDI